MPGDVHPRLPVPGLGCGIGRIIVIPVFIFTGYKAAIASIAFGYIDYKTPFCHIVYSLFLSG
jgi:hypothetical protein